MEKHFTKILNLHREFAAEKFDKVRQNPLRSDRTEPPLEEELDSAPGKLKSRNTAKKASCQCEF